MERIKGGLVCIGGSLIRLIRRGPAFAWDLPPRGEIPHHGPIAGRSCPTCGAVAPRPVNESGQRLRLLLESIRKGPPRRSP